MKIISVSRKKIIVHEDCYAKFTSANGNFPLAGIAIPILNLDDIRTEKENLETISEYKQRLKIPDHVLSIKAHSDYRKHPELNEETPRTHPSPEILKTLPHQTTYSWEKTVCP
jgi:hypothetical protein